MGFDTHEYAFGDMGDLGTRYYAMGSNLISGYSVGLAASPETEDIVAVLTSNVELPAGDFLRDVISDWAAPDG